MARLTFYFDFISPYAYLGWKALPSLEARSGCEARIVPVLFAGLLNHHGSIGPGEIAAKRVYIYTDAARRARQRGIPFAMPPSHPFNPLTALRLVSLDLELPVRRSLIDRLFDVAWGGARPAGPTAGLDHVDTFPAVLTELVGREEAEWLLTACGEPAHKARLRAQTDEAIAAGVFGVPSYVAVNPAGEASLFWGQDTADLVEHCLADGDRVSPSEIERWAELPTTAQRSGAPPLAGS